MSFKFEFDPRFDKHASNWEGTLNPLGNVVREATDKIGRRARDLAKAEQARWQDTKDTTRNLVRSRNKADRLRYFRAKAMAYSLGVYVQTLRFIMVDDGDENYGSVESFHAAGAEIEFGGTDNKIELGRTGTYLTYPAFGFLRRSLNG